MAQSNVSIRMDEDVKREFDRICTALGINMSTAVTMFAKTMIREQGIPFELKLNVPNEVTAAAIEEGRRLAYDKSAAGYSSMDDLKAALAQ